MAEILSARTESVRLSQDAQKWLDEWVDRTGQDKSLVLRAGLRLLMNAVDGLDLGEQVTLTVALGRGVQVDLESGRVAPTQAAQQALNRALLRLAPDETPAQPKPDLGSRIAGNNR